MRNTAHRLCIPAIVASLLWGRPAFGDDLPPGLPALADAKQCRPPALIEGGPTHPDAAAITGRIRPALVGSATAPATLAQRMTDRRVPGVSVAVIRGGRLSWARGFGVRDTATCEPVTPTTVFQAASISKSFAAVLAMQAVREGRLSLDGDINRHLVRWSLPTGAGAPAGATATLRRLLGHTAAVSVPDSTGVRPGDPMPSIVQVLRGEAPAKGPPVAIVGEPGREFSYSNGGYHVVELALEDATGRPFAALARDRILAPLGMTRSDFQQPPTLGERAAGHHEGRPFVDKAYWVPGLASGGLWTTPTDLARFLIALRDAADGRDGALLPKPLADQMLRPGPGDKDAGDWGLGLSLKDGRFGHDGGFWGMMARMWIDRATGDGIVVLSNGEEGLPLADEIIHAAADHYGWPGLGSRLFAATRDAGPILLRGTMNDWGEADRMVPDGPGRYTAELEVPAGRHFLKVASADWRTFVLGSPRDPATLDRPLHLSPDGLDVAFTAPEAGRYRFVLDAPDSGAATLRIVRLDSPR